MKLSSALASIPLILACLTAQAAPANCDADMTEDQRFQLDICSSHAGCKFVVSIMDACISVKSFISRLGLGPRGSTGRVTDDRLNAALPDMGSNGGSLADCTIRFDRAMCRQYLGIDQPAIDAPPEPVKFTRKQELGNQISDFIQQARKGKDEADYRLAQTGLELCAASKEFSDREQRCNDAQRSVEACNKFRDQWQQRKAAVLAEVRRENPKIGEQFSSGASKIRQSGAPLRNQDEIFNDSVRLLVTMDMPPCPYTLPQTWLTPAQALAEWKKEETKPNQLRKDVDTESDALVAVPLRRGGGSAGSAVFQGAIDQAAREESERRDARERLERERLAALDRGRAERSPSRAGMSGGSTSMRAASAGSRNMSCRDLMNSLIGPAHDGNPLVEAGANLHYRLGQIYSDNVWTAQIYMRVVNSHPACANDRESRETVAEMLRQVQENCRQASKYQDQGPFDCNAGRSYHAPTAARLEAAVSRLFDDSSDAAPMGASGGAGDADCATAYARQEAEFSQVNQRIANMQSVVAKSQFLLGMLNKRMALLDRLCKGQPQYAEYPTLRQQYESSLRACRGMASVPSDCVPK